MDHLNGNIICCVDTETTGVIPGFNDIIEVCVLPLTFELSPSQNILPFSIEMVPKRPENIDFEAIRVQRTKYGQSLDDGYGDGIVRSKEKILKTITSGLDAYRAGELFVDWFEKLRLAPKKRIMPLAQNWAFDREFLIDWLGWKTFEYVFDPRYRDTMSISLYENDRADYRGLPVPFQKNSLGYLCKAMSVDRGQAHTALDDCVATAENYRKMIHNPFLG